ncbi:MAG: hypothetical protein M1833_000352 [Piccolia ochrophora]|nr:MAG: hypothetical protein M1833_000352 [Piccolia ochrophora]
MARSTTSNKPSRVRLGDELSSAQPRISRRGQTSSEESHPNDGTVRDDLSPVERSPDLDRLRQPRNATPRMETTSLAQTLVSLRGEGSRHVDEARGNNQHEESSTDEAVPLTSPEGTSTNETQTQPINSALGHQVSKGDTARILPMTRSSQPPSSPTGDSDSHWMESFLLDSSLCNQQMQDKLQSSCVWGFLESDERRVLQPAISLAALMVSCRARLSWCSTRHLDVAAKHSRPGEATVAEWGRHADRICLPEDIFEQDKTMGVLLDNLPQVVESSAESWLYFELAITLHTLRTFVRFWRRMSPQSLGWGLWQVFVLDGVLTQDEPPFGAFKISPNGDPRLAVNVHTKDIERLKSRDFWEKVMREPEKRHNWVKDQPWSGGQTMQIYPYLW